ELCEAAGRAASDCRLPRLHLALVGDVLRLTGVMDDLERIAGHRDSLQAQHLDWSRRPGIFDDAAAIIEHCAHPAKHLAGDERVAHFELALLDQHGCDSAAAAVELGFEDYAGREPVWISF